MVDTKLLKNSLPYVQAICIEKHEAINYMVAWLPNNSLTPFVCGWNPTYDDDGVLIYWGQGHYFTNLTNAIEYINEIYDKEEKIDIRKY